MRKKRSLSTFKTALGALRFLELEINRFKELVKENKLDLNAIEQLEEIKRWLKYLQRLVR